MQLAQPAIIMTKSSKSRNRLTESRKDFLHELGSESLTSTKPLGKEERKDKRTVKSREVSALQKAIASRDALDLTIASLQASQRASEASNIIKGKRGRDSPDKENLTSKKSSRSAQAASEAVSDIEFVDVNMGSDVDSDCNDNSGYESVQSRKSRRNTNKVSSATRATDPVSIAGKSNAVLGNKIGLVKKTINSPLTVVGVPSDIIKNQFMSLKFLNVSGNDVRRYDPLPNGKVLIHPKNDEAKARIESAATDAISIKPAVRRPPKRDEGLSVVLLRIDPSISDADIQEASGIKAKRLIAAKTNAATYKVRLYCDSKAQKDKLIKEGISLSGIHYMVENYKTGPAPLQCYRCQGLNHMAYQCTKTDKCMRCAGDHASKECPVKEDLDKRACANCGGKHAANSPECPRIKEAKVVAQTKQLTYAAAVAKKGDTTECHRLAAVITDVVLTVVQCLPCGAGSVNPNNLSEIVAKAVSRHYKVDVSAHCLATNLNERFMAKLAAAKNQQSSASRSANESVSHSTSTATSNSAAGAPVRHTTSALVHNQLVPVAAQHSTTISLGPHNG